jgi:hypothetical protein
MAHVPLLEVEQAPLQVKTVYEEFHRRMSFPSPPNFIMDARPLSRRGAGNVGGGAECPGLRRDSAMDEGDDICRHLEGSNMPVLHGCPLRLLPHDGSRVRHAGSPR